MKAFYTPEGETGRVSEACGPVDFFKGNTIMMTGWKPEIQTEHQGYCSTRA